MIEYYRAYGHFFGLFSALNWILFHFLHVRAWVVFSFFFEAMYISMAMDKVPFDVVGSLLAFVDRNFALGSWSFMQR